MLAQSGVLQRLLSLLTEPNADPTIRIDAAIIIGKRVDRDDAFITDLFTKNALSLTQDHLPKEQKHMYEH